MLKIPSSAYAVNLAAKGRGAGVLRRSILAIPNSIPMLVLLIVALAIYSFSTNVTAQDESSLPFDLSGAPSAEDVASQLESAGRLEGLNEEEKHQLIELTSESMRFAYLMLSLNTYSSCVVEVQQYCSTTPKNKINSCLFSQHDNLGACCASNVRRLVGKTGIPAPMEYRGVTLPEGSEFNFSKSCRLDDVVIPTEMRIGDVLVAPGPLRLYESGKVAMAKIVDGQSYRGFSIADAMNDGTSFYRSGVPTEVIVAGESNYKGARIETGSRVSFYEDGAVKSLKTDQDFTDTKGRVLRGDLELYSSGLVKRGRLAQPWRKANVELRAGTTAFFDGSGDFEAIHIASDIGLPGLDKASGKFNTYSNGQIKQLTLGQRAGVAINGIAYPEFTTIAFAQDGSVVGDNFRDKNMTPARRVFNHRKQWQFEELQEPLSVGAWIFPPKSIVLRDEKGALKSVTLAEPLKVGKLELSPGHIELSHGASNIHFLSLSKPYESDGLRLPIGTEVSVRLDGVINNARSASGVYYKSNRVASGSPILFHRSGVIKEIGLDKGATLVQHQFNPVVKARYDESGVLYSMYAREPLAINEIEFDGNWIFFYPNGDVYSGILNRDTRIQGVLYAAGAELRLDNNGGVVHSVQRKPRWPDGKPPEPVKTQGIPIDVSGVNFTVKRVPLTKPASPEQCLKLFGEPDAAGNYKNRPAFSSSVENPAEFGCVANDKQAGILSRD